MTTADPIQTLLNVIQLNVDTLKQALDNQHIDSSVAIQQLDQHMNNIRSCVTAAHYNNQLQLHKLSTKPKNNVLPFNKS